MRKLISTAAVLLLAVSFSASSADSGAKRGASDPLLGQELTAKLLKAQPNIPIDHVVQTPMPGVLAVVLTDGTELYGSADGRFLFSGDMYSLDGNNIVNLAETRRASKRLKLLQDPLFDDALVFAAKGQRKASINVFTDVDCGYCRKLHQEVPQLNAMGIEVRYLAYPRAGVGSDSYRKIASAWCSDNPNAALTKLKSGGTIASKVCQPNPVAEQFQLGQRMGISGTPAIILEDGRLLPGYMPAKELAATLGI